MNRFWIKRILSSIICFEIKGTQKFFFEYWILFLTYKYLFGTTSSQPLIVNEIHLPSFPPSSRWNLKFTQIIPLIFHNISPLRVQIGDARNRYPCSPMKNWLYHQLPFSWFFFYFSKMSKGKRKLKIKVTESKKV